MGVLEDATEVVKNALVKENKPYTYKLLSRHLNIHVDDSKKLLYSFHQKYQDIVEATYLISGRLNNSTDLTIKFTKDINEKDKFDQIQSIQIYSLSPKNIEINEILSTVNAQIREIHVDEAKLAKWGLIKGPELVKIDQPATASGNSGSTTTAPSRSNTSTSRLPIGGSNKEKEPTTKKNEFPDMGLRSAQILNRNKKPQDEKPRARTTTQPTFGSSSKKPTTSKQQSQPRSRTDPTSKTSSSKPIEVEETEEEINKRNSIKAEKDKKQKELESMFDDDDDDFEASQSQKVKEKPDDKPEPSIEEVKDTKGEDLEGIFDSSFTQSQSQQKPQEQDDTQKIDEPEVIEEPEVNEPPMDDKPNDEQETTSYYDEDGYLVTTVKEKPKAKQQSKPKPKARSSAPPVSNSQPAAKKAKTGKGAGGKGQTSLMSFFGKK